MEWVYVFRQVCLKKNFFCKQNHFTLATQYEEVSLYQMQGRFLQSLMLMFCPLIII